MISRKSPTLAAATASQSGNFITAKPVNFLPARLKSCDVGGDCDIVNGEYTCEERNKTGLANGKKHIKSVFAASSYARTVIYKE